MDSVTQAVLGASIAGACAPAGHRRKALLAGAALGTLPDLDVFIDYGGAVENFTFHRGFSHSLFVLLPFSLLLWLALRRWWAPVRESPHRWLAAIALTLLTHPLLDAHTAYGTQLLWPLTTPPVMWSTLFIIDPLYTLPLIVGIIVAATWPALPRSDTALRTALAISTLYIGWAWAGKLIVENNAREALADMGLPDAPVFSTPTPFNTLLWRVVAMTDDGYLEGFDSLVVPEPTMQFTAYPADKAAMSAASDIWAVQRLRWFASDFVAARMDGETLLMDDLRMGQSPYFVFTHAVATRGNPHFKAIPTELIEFSFEDRALAETWQRIWADREPVDNF